MEWLIHEWSDGALNIILSLKNEQQQQTKEKSGHAHKKRNNIGPLNAAA